MVVVRGVDQKKVRAGLERRAYCGCHLGRRLHRDALQAELDLQYARERCRIVEAEFRTGQWMRASLENDALIGAHRRVARIVFDLDEGDIDVRLCRWRILRECADDGASESKQTDKCEAER